MRLLWERFSNQAQWIKAPVFIITLTDMKKTCLDQSLHRSGYRRVRWLRGLRDLLGGCTTRHNLGLRCCGLRFDATRWHFRLRFRANIPVAPIAVLHVASVL